MMRRISKMLREIRIPGNRHPAVAYRRHGRSGIGADTPSARR